MMADWNRGWDYHNAGEAGRARNPISLNLASAGLLVAIRDRLTDTQFSTTRLEQVSQQKLPTFSATFGFNMSIQNLARVIRECRPVWMVTLQCKFVQQRHCILSSKFVFPNHNNHLSSTRSRKV